MKTKITKKQVSEMTRTSVDGFGRTFSIDTRMGEFDFVLIANREALKSKVEIEFNGNVTTQYMNGSSKKEFVDCVFKAIKAVTPDNDISK